jgi:hypothetical protein
LQVDDPHETFLQNLRFALAHQIEPKQSATAEAMGVDKTTVYRWFNGDSKPNSYSKKKIATYLNLPLSDLEKPHEEFVTLYPRHLPVLTPPKSKRGLRLNLIPKWRNSLTDSFENLKGCYLLRYRWASAFKKDYLHAEHNRIQFDSQLYTTSLMNIADEDADSMGFVMHGCVESERGRVAWQYEGLLYPIYDYLYFIGESDRTNSLISIVASAPRSVPPVSMTGYISIAAGLVDKDDGGVDGACRAGPVQFVYQRRQPASPDEFRDKIGTFRTRHDPSVLPTPLDVVPTR